MQKREVKGDSDKTNFISGYNWKLLCYSLIQTVLFIFKGTSLYQANYVFIPYTYEQPILSIFNSICFKFPKIYICKALKELNLIHVFHLSILSTLIYIFLSKNGKSKTAFLFSTLLLFDEPTIALISKTPSSALQMIFIVLSIIFIEKNSKLSLFRPFWIFNTFISWTFAVFSFSLRIESLPILLIILLQLEKALSKDSNLHPFIKFLRFFGIIFVLFILTIFCGALLFSVFFVFGMPKWEYVKPDPKLIIAELIIHPHNFALYLLLIFSIVLLICDRSNISCVPYFIISILILFLPLSCLVNDLLVKVSLSKLVMIISAGILFLETKCKFWSKLFLIFTFILVIYFFFYPIAFN